MDESLSGKILSKMVIAIFVIALVDLIYLNWWVLKSQKLEAGSENLTLEQTANDLKQTSGSPEPIADSSPSPSASPEVETEVKTETKTVVEKQTQTVIQTAQKEIFIPMGSGSTTSNSFVDLNGTDVAIDTSKYSTIDQVVFEASLRVEGGNGKATAKITNVTDNNPLFESEISTTSGTATVKTSGKIPIPQGVKTYRVQAKTDLVNFPARVENARIKITLK